MKMDRSTRTLIAVVTLVAAILLAVRLVIESAPVGDWLLATILFLISAALWVGLAVEAAEGEETPAETPKTVAKKVNIQANATVEKAKAAVEKAGAAMGLKETPPLPFAPEPEPAPPPPAPVVEEKVIVPPSDDPGEVDDLTRIEGIGPKYRDVLVNAGFKTFDQIAKSTTANLLTALKAAGMRRPASIVTWVEQAGYAAKDDWEGLDKLQEELQGGRR